MVVRPNNNRAGASWGNTSWQSRRGGTPASLPARIKCARGEWKTRDQFSNKKLGDYSNMVAAGMATAEDSKILCREHTSNQVTEMQCRTCHQIMSLMNFSKSTIRNKQYTCKDCVAYRTAETDLNLPPPGAQLSPDEIAAAQRIYQDIASFDDVADDTQPSDQLDNFNTSNNSNNSHDEEAEEDDGDDYGDDFEGYSDDDRADDRDDESQSNGTWGNYSAGSSFDSDAGYTTDGSEGTVRAGLGSSVYTGSLDGRSAPQLNDFSVPSRSRIGNSGSSWVSGSRSTSGNTSYSTNKTTSTSTNKTAPTTSNPEPVRERNNSKWAKKPKKCDFNVPDYMRNRLWTDENVTTPRDVDYESDDSL